MGTRNLVAVVIDGDFKVAQYGQWDGYPDGQGKTVLEFLQHFEVADFKAAFIEKLRACKWLTAERGAEIDKIQDWHEKFPHLSRNTGGKILNMIAASPTPLELQDTRGFAGDSLMCEWGYVVDLDTNVFEVYQGFNKVPTPPESRFPSGAKWYGNEGSEGYEPIRLVKSYQIDQLPTVDAFIEEIVALTADPADVEEAA